MSDTPLKPCPWCESTDIQLNGDTEGRDWYACAKCGACGPYEDDAVIENDPDASAWNGRVHRDDHPSPAERRAAWVSFAAACLVTQTTKPAMEQADEMLKEYDARFGGEKGKP